MGFYIFKTEILRNSLNTDCFGYYLKITVLQFLYIRQLTTCYLVFLSVMLDGFNRLVSQPLLTLMLEFLLLVMQFPY